MNYIWPVKAVLGLAGLLALLKVLGSTDLGWMWVLAPLWAPGLAVAAFVLASSLVRRPRPAAGASWRDPGFVATATACVLPVAARVAGLVDWPWVWALAPVWVLGLLVGAFGLLLAEGFREG